MNVLRLMRHSQFLKHNAIFFAGSVLVGALNYLYYPILGRMLSTTSFGEVQTLVSLFLQLSVFLTVLSMVIVNIVANYDDEVKRNTFIFEFEKLALAISAFLLLLSLALRTQIQAWLRFESPWPFVVLALAIIASVPFVLRGAFLRGKQTFGLVSAGNIAAAGGKLVLSVVLVAAGLGTIGAIGGVLVAQILACFLIGFWAYNLGLRASPETKKWRLPNARILAPELRYGGIVLIASLAITLQYSMDIVLIKHYFNAHVAGLYAGVAAVGRILFFLTASVAQVMISKVKMGASQRANAAMLRNSLLLLCGLSLPILVLLMAFPKRIIGLLMGTQYESFAGVLARLSLAIFIVSVVNIFVSYYLALRRHGVAIAAVVGAVLTYFFILLHHGSPSAVVDGLLMGSAVSLAAVGVWKLTERRYGYEQETHIDRHTRV